MESFFRFFFKEMEQPAASWKKVECWNNFFRKKNIIFSEQFVGDVRMSQLRSADGFHDNRKVTPRYHENASYMNVIQDVATIISGRSDRLVNLLPW